MSEESEAVRAAVEGELRLLDPGVRRSPDRVTALLHPEFREFGASGRVWDRAAVVTLLKEEAGRQGPPVTVSGMKGVRLGPGVVHLTYGTDTDGRRAHRSSLWRLTDEGWRLYFPQGTPVPHSGTGYA